MTPDVGTLKREHPRETPESLRAIKRPFLDPEKMFGIGNVPSANGAPSGYGPSNDFPEVPMTPATELVLQCDVLVQPIAGHRKLGRPPVIASPDDMDCD